MIHCPLQFCIWRRFSTRGPHLVKSGRSRAFLWGSGRWCAGWGAGCWTRAGGVAARILVLQPLPIKHGVLFFPAKLRSVLCFLEQDRGPPSDSLGGGPRRDGERRQGVGYNLPLIVQSGRRCHATFSSCFSAINVFWGAVQVVAVYFKAFAEPGGGLDLPCHGPQCGRLQRRFSLSGRRRRASRFQSWGRSGFEVL